MMADMPTWLADQVEAATAASRRAVAAAGFATDKGDPAWDEMGTDLGTRAVLRWAADGGKVCPHGTAAPIPLLLLMWKPEALVCNRCMVPLLAQMRDSDEDTRCDNCKQVPDDGIVNPIGMTLGPITILGGVCTACAGGEAAPVAPRQEAR